MSHANTLTQDRGTPLRDSQRGGGWQRRTKIRWPVLYMGKEYDKVGKKWVNCKVCKGKGKYWRRCNSCYGGTCKICGGQMQKCQNCKGTGKRPIVGY